MKEERTKDYDYFIEKGWTYNPTTGELKSHKGSVIKSSTPIIITKDKTYGASATRLCYYMHTGILPQQIINYKNGDKNDWRFENLFFKEKVVKEKKEKLVKLKVTKEKPVKKYYVKDTELLYEIIISQGRGKMTEKLERMLFTICKNVIKRFDYKSTDDAYDVMMGSYLHLIQNWQKFNTDKHSVALPYITEVVKRSLVNNFNILVYHKYIPTHDRQRFISLSTTYY